MKLSHLFPDQYRAFCNGPLSMCVERFGGIDSISLLDIREFDGKLYPDRFPIPWLRRSGSSMEHPLYGPGIRFMHGGGQYVPENAELFPFGCRSEQYSMVLAQNGVGFCLKGHPDGIFRMVLSRLHMQQGDLPSLQNQLAVRASNIQWLPEELRGTGFHSDFPFPEHGMKFLRGEPEFDPISNALIFSAECIRTGYVKTLYWVVTADHPLTSETLPDGCMLCAAVRADSAVHLGFGFGDSREEALRNAAAFVKDFASGFRRMEQTCVPALELDIEGMPEASDFMRCFPGYQRSLLLAETPREMAIRAAADKFGFFAMWDHVYPARDFLLTGEPERTAKALRYLLNYPHVETCLWITMHLIITCNEYLAFTGDSAMLQEAMPHFKRYFKFAERFIDPVTGLVKNTLNCGVDNSKQAGLSGLFFASCLNGWWYDACRALENLAAETGDFELSLFCRETAQKIDAHYEEAFYVVKHGYLRAARDEDGSLPSIEIYQNTHTLGLDYVHGRYLFRRIMRSLADYQALELYHPMGHTAVSFDSAVPCEMWKFVHMNQHLGHECKLARFGGRPEEAFRVMQGYLDYFDQYRSAIETFNLAGCSGDTVQTANWQAFSATAAAQALCRALAGLEYHRGGLSWTPAYGDREIRLKHFRFRDREYELHVTGKGAYVKRMSLNGNALHGTMQIPVDLNLPERVFWEIERTESPAEHPVLLTAIDAPIGEVVCRGATLEFKITAAVHAPVQIASTSFPRLLLNGMEQKFEWYEREKFLWFDAVFEAGDRITVTM